VTFERKGRVMPDWWWSAEERALSYRVLRLLRELDDPRPDHWVSRGTLAEHLGIDDPDDETLYSATQILTQNGQAEPKTADRWLLKATSEGGLKTPPDR
jgi:hypothetical protein